MNNNILPLSSQAIFEPHISTNSELPFIYHKDVVIGKGICNFHENIEILFFVEGKGYLKCDSDLIEVQTGEIAVINSYSVHQTESTSKLIYYCLIVNKTFFKDNNIDVENLQFKHLIIDESMNHLFRNIVKEYETENILKFAGIKSAVLTMLLYLCRNYSGPSKRQPLHSKDSLNYILLSMNFIKANLHRKLSIDEIAANIGISKYYFIRLFKKATGYTVTDHINMLRCERAKELLINEKYSVKQAANLCGFDNCSYFSNVFKKYIGLTPSEYRKASPK